MSAFYLVLVPVHSSKGTNVREDVLKSIGQLEGINIAEAELDIRVHNQLRETKNFTAKMEGVSESGLLSLFGGKGPLELRVSQSAVRMIRVLT
jgi:hypothetical protein